MVDRCPGRRPVHAYLSNFRAALPSSDQTGYTGSVQQELIGVRGCSTRVPDENYGAKQWQMKDITSLSMS